MTATNEQRAATRLEMLSKHHDCFYTGNYMLQDGIVIGSRVELKFLGVNFPPTDPILTIEAVVVDHYVPHYDGCWVLEMSDGRTIHLDPYSASSHVGASDEWVNDAEQFASAVESGRIPPGSDFWCYYGQTGVCDSSVPTPEGAYSAIFNDEFKTGKYDPIPKELRVRVPIGVNDPSLYGQVSIRILEK